MSASLTANHPAQANDNIVIALFFAIALHGLVLLGVSFYQGPPALPKATPSLDVILVQTVSHEAPEEAEHIAQHNQVASGSSDKPQRTTSPVTSFDPNAQNGIAPMKLEASQKEQQQTREQTRLITVAESEQQLIEEDNTKADQEERIQSAKELVQRSLEIARLTAELDLEQRLYSQRPRVHYIDATSAKSAVEASYLQSWTQKVERLGNLNYPDQAIRQRLSGSLILNVLIDSYGLVLDIEVAETSGHRVLDDAAKRIVQDASPFNRFPAAMRKDYDQLLITRTWVFKTNNELETH